MGWKTRETNFAESNELYEQNMLWINRRKEVWKNVFLYSHEYRDQKMGGGNSQNNFSRNTRIVRTKNVGKKSSEKSAKNVFLYSHIISWPKNVVEKTRETIFPETH